MSEDEGVAALAAVAASRPRLPTPSASSRTPLPLSANTEKRRHYMKLIKHFNSFLSECVNLSEARLQSLDSRVNSVSNFLKSGENPISSRYIGVIPQGSYAHRTMINPVGKYDEFDADVLLELEENVDWTAGDYVEELYKVFRSSGKYVHMVSRHAHCVKVDYANEFHIDVVPYLRRHGSYYVTNRDDDVFELTNPEGFNEWLDEKNRTAGGRLVKVIRLFKYLRDYKNTFSAKSIILNILLGGRVNSVLLLGDPKRYCDLPTAFINILSDLNDYLRGNPVMPSLDDPSCPGQNFNHRWSEDQYQNFRDKVARYYNWARSAFDEEDRDESIRLWRKIFGDSFASTPAASVAKSSAATERTVEFIDTEQHIHRDYGIPEQLDARYKVRMSARVVVKPGFRSFDLRRHGNVVGRDRQIEFHIADCTVPAPYEIYWKVKNSGLEAMVANCIRGQIEKDNGASYRREPTKYRGKHYVECYVVQNGVCVAKDHQVVIIK
ncbi:cyclic GMP-AMP synthase DncV-like nucleotidyltransferase [Streptomyces sp. NPDC056291]|uniref:SMODS domain-containing nucleotidyltransferase n=1 Tax=Streptomyces sp. NPDC056291 TaxID=3345772 RepID=UPI0035E097C2